MWIRRAVVIVGTVCALLSGIANHGDTHGDDKTMTTIEGVKVA
jgi:hypothetical protein